MENNNNSITTRLSRSTIYDRHEARRARTMLNEGDNRPAVVRVMAGLPGFRNWIPSYQEKQQSEFQKTSSSIENSDSAFSTKTRSSQDLSNTTSTTTIMFHDPIKEQQSAPDMTPIATSPTASNENKNALPLLATGTAALFVGSAVYSMQPKQSSPPPSVNAMMQLHRPQSTVFTRAPTAVVAIPAPQPSRFLVLQPIGVRVAAFVVGYAGMSKLLLTAER